jgi:hypothetical protein
MERFGPRPLVASAESASCALAKQRALDSDPLAS